MQTNVHASETLPAPSQFDRQGM